MEKFTNNIPTTVKGAFRRMLPYMSQFHNSTVEKVADDRKIVADGIPTALFEVVEHFNALEKR